MKPNANAKVTHRTLIAPCGINCRLCQAYGREKNACPGCRGDDDLKSKSCLACHIKNCDRMAQGIKYCFDCAEFPCERLEHLDKRYRTRYATSPIENLIRIQTGGITIFVKSENEKWGCPRCGAMLCMHKPECLTCGYPWHSVEDTAEND